MRRRGVAPKGRRHIRRHRHGRRREDCGEDVDDDVSGHSVDAYANDSLHHFQFVEGKDVSESKTVEEGARVAAVPPNGHPPLRLDGLRR